MYKSALPEQASNPCVVRVSDLHLYPYLPCWHESLNLAYAMRLAGTWACNSWQLPEDSIMLTGLFTGSIRSSWKLAASEISRQPCSSRAQSL